MAAHASSLSVSGSGKLGVGVGGSGGNGGGRRGGGLGGAQAVAREKKLRLRLESNSRASRQAAMDVELQFASFSSVTLVVSPFEVKEVASRVGGHGKPLKVVSNIHVLEPTPQV